MSVFNWKEMETWAAW